MGDNNRATIFADWLLKYFPPARYPRVADLAGGKGALSKELRKRGYESVVFDCRRRKNQNESWSRRRCDLEKYKPKKGEFNLVVGMHPDEVTWHVMRIANDLQVPFVVVPCCIKPPKQKATIQINSFGQWLNWLKQEGTNMGFHIQQSDLHMQGKNILLQGTRK